MNQINPKKLLNSKWTAVVPVAREKHFIVTQVKFNEQGEVVLCLIESVLSKREQSIDWRTLKDVHNWQQGWQ